MCSVIIPSDFPWPPAGCFAPWLWADAPREGPWVFYPSKDAPGNVIGECQVREGQTPFPLISLPSGYNPQGDAPCPSPQAESQSSDYSVKTTEIRFKTCSAAAFNFQLECGGRCTENITAINPDPVCHPGLKGTKSLISWQDMIFAMACDRIATKNCKARYSQCQAVLEWVRPQLSLQLV